MAEPEDDFDVSIVGRAVISNDRALIKELWSPLAKVAITGTPPTDLGEHGTMVIGGQPHPSLMR